jgi:accessory gene regulator protein AgrB
MQAPMVIIPDPDQLNTSLITFLISIIFGIVIGMLLTHQKPIWIRAVAITSLVIGCYLLSNFVIQKTFSR